MSSNQLSLKVDFVGHDKLSATTRAIMEANKNAAKQIKSARDEVTKLNKSLADIKSLRSASAELKKHQTATKEAAAKLAMLKSQIVAGEAPSKALVRSIQSAEKNLFKMQAAEKAAATSTKEMMANLRSAGVDITRLGAHEKDLAAKIERTNASIKRQSYLLDGQKTRVKGLMAEEVKRDKANGKASPVGHESSDHRDLRKLTGLDIRSMGQRGAGIATSTFDYAREAANAGAQFEALTYRLRALGLSPDAVANLQAYAKNMNIAGSSATDNMRLIVEAQGAFRESGKHTMEEQLAGAKLMAPLIARLNVSMKALGQEMTPELERDLLRVVEMQGGLTNPKKAAELTDGLFRAIISSGGNVDATNYQTFLGAAGSSANGLSKRALFADFEPLIAEMHQSAGVGLYTAWKRANGMVKSQPAMREMIRLGAWDKDKIIFNRVDGIKEFKNGQNPFRADLAKDLNESPVDFYLKMRAMYKAKGVTDINRENVMLFGGTGGKLFNLIEKQLSVIMEARGSYDKTLGIGETHQMVVEGMLGANAKLDASIENIKISFAETGGALSAFTASLNAASSLLSWLNGTTAPSTPRPAANPVDWSQWRSTRPANVMPAAAFTTPRPAAAHAPQWHAIPAAPITLHVHGAPGQAPDVIADHAIRKLEEKRGVAGRSTYDAGR
ncbi:hypothetical protein EOE18_13755 [Novosphingobium umbonatum]|uniref:Phage tail tape measure protein n=1 Tax=Novosphingobium umbonatum TaxID=1908524 RepID=A0A3S2UST0_9SPHN|nr:FlxA-like family protein [Novosphingobium umbonatum]RVU03918.1 hypothetical protein EOE18_13755 [Novosphingobium umbonatum]